MQKGSKIFHIPPSVENKNTGCVNAVGIFVRRKEVFMIFNQKIRVYCPGCGRLVGECSSKSHIDKTYKCRNCNKMVVYHTETGEREIKKLPKRNQSSGMTFM